MSEYPEHDKVKALNGHNQTAGEFLDWLTDERGFTLCEWRECRHADLKNNIEFEASGFFPNNKSTDSLLAEFFKIDQRKMEAENREILSDFRKDNGIEV